MILNMLCCGFSFSELCLKSDVLFLFSFFPFLLKYVSFSYVWCTSKVALSFRCITKANYQATLLNLVKHISLGGCIFTTGISNAQNCQDSIDSVSAWKWACCCLKWYSLLSQNSEYTKIRTMYEHRFKLSLSLVMTMLYPYKPLNLASKWWICVNPKIMCWSDLVIQLLTNAQHAM